MPDSAPYWHCSLRLIGTISVVVLTASLSVGPLIITIIILCPRRSIGVVGRGG
jgi:hypothetical protein